MWDFDAENKLFRHLQEAVKIEKDNSVSKVERNVGSLLELFAFNIFKIS